MSDLQSLLQERELLERKIREARRQQIDEAVATCRRLIAEHELTENDLFGAKGRRKKPGASGIKVAPKYRNPVTGETWTGRGKAPKWIQESGDRNALLIK